jgi:mannose-6-phosphate isomerase-like protein (cupin superfamily)
LPCQRTPVIAASADDGDAVIGEGKRHVRRHPRPAARPRGDRHDHVHHPQQSRDLPVGRRDRGGERVRVDAARHANANELTYCVSGTALVSVLDDGSRFSTFIVTAGQTFHVDSGALHHIENIGTDVAEFIIAFRSERPEDFGLAATFGAFTDAVLGNTYDLPASDVAKLHRDTHTDHELAARIGDPDAPTPWIPSRSPLRFVCISRR